MKRTFLHLLAIVLLLTACGQSLPTDTTSDTRATMTWQEQYDLGMRYLIEGNYQEAIIAFTAAIEIDPKLAEAYVGLADAYMGQGDINQARLALEQGISSADDKEALRLRLAELNGDEELSVEPNLDETAMSNVNTESTIEPSENLIRFDEVNFCGLSIDNLSIEAMKAAARSAGYEVYEGGLNDSFTAWHVSSFGISDSDIFGVNVHDNKLWINYQYGPVHTTYANVHIPIGMRNIHTYDTLESVITELELVVCREQIMRLVNSLINKEFDVAPSVASHSYNEGNVSVNSFRYSYEETETGKIKPIEIIFSLSFAEHED